MTQFEYRQVSTEQYTIYYKKAQKLLEEVSTFLSVPIPELAYTDIITYFEMNYNIHFSFFDIDPIKKHGNRKWVRALSNKGWIRYKEVIKNASFSALDEEIVKRVSGFTIPNGHRVLIMINQNCVFPRLIFTILHELCHFYFHINNELKTDVFVSLTNDKLEGNYSKEMIPFEDEANNIASILFCPKQKLEEMLLSNMNFKQMCHNVGMSVPAMHNRLLNYFEHVLRMVNPLALKTVWGVRSGDLQALSLVKRRIKALQKEESDRNEALELLKMQSAYIDKLNASPFWNSIVGGVEEYNKELASEYLSPELGEEYVEVFKPPYPFPNPIEEEHAKELRDEYLVSDLWDDFNPFN